MRERLREVPQLLDFWAESSVPRPRLNSHNADGLTFVWAATDPAGLARPI